MRTERLFLLLRLCWHGPSPQPILCGDKWMDALVPRSCRTVAVHVPQSARFFLFAWKSVNVLHGSRVRCALKPVGLVSRISKQAEC